MLTYAIDASALLKPHPTGVERYVFQLLQAMMLQPLDVEAERIVLYAPGPQPAGLQLPVGWSWKMLGFWLPKGWTHLRLSLELCVNPPDVFFSPAHEIPFFHRRSKIMTTVHDVVFRHVPAAYSAQGLRRQELAIKRAAKTAQIILAVSEATKSDLVNLYGVPAERIRVTHLAPAQAVEHEISSAQVLQRHGLTPGLYVLYTGRIENKKNPLTLIKAFIELRRRYGAGQPLKLVMVGSEGHGGAEAIAAAKAANCANDILFLGFVSDGELRVLMQNAMCFAFPSLGEGFGIPVLEAMAAGAPVIASDLPVLREVAQSVALFVPPNDVANWTVAIDTLLVDQERRQQLVAAGYARVKDFSWEKTASLTWQALRATARE